MMYMKISLSDFLTVFAARTRAPCYSRAPGGLLFVAATFALGCSTLLSAYWPFPELKPLEWSLLGYVRLDCSIFGVVPSVCCRTRGEYCCAGLDTGVPLLQRDRSGATASAGSSCKTLRRSCSSNLSNAWSRLLCNSRASRRTTLLRRFRAASALSRRRSKNSLKSKQLPLLVATAFSKSTRDGAQRLCRPRYQ